MNFLKSKKTLLVEKEKTIVRHSSLTGNKSRVSLTKPSPLKKKETKNDQSMFNSFFKKENKP